MLSVADLLQQHPNMQNIFSVLEFLEGQVKFRQGKCFF